MLKISQNSRSNVSILTFLFVIACCIFNACKKEDKEEDNTPLPTLITVVSESLAAKYTVLVTDSAGDILAQHSVEQNSSIELKSVKPYDKEYINVFYHTQDMTGNSRVQGYVKIKKGFVLEISEGNFTYTPVQVHVKNDNTNFSKLQISTGADYREFTSLSDTASEMVFNFYPNHSMFVQAEKEGALFYKSYTIDQRTGVTIDLSEVNTPMAKKSIELPLNTTYFGINTICKFNSSDEEYYYLGSNSAQLDGSTDTYECNYPPAGLFQNYKYLISWNDYSNLVESYGNEYNKGVPDKFEPLKISCNVENSDPTQFKVAFNADIDFYKIYFFQGNNTINLNVSGGIKEFKLPNVAQIFNDQNLNLSTFKLRQITAVNVLEFTKEDFLNNYVKSESPVTEIYDTQNKHFGFRE